MSQPILITAHWQIARACYLHLLLYPELIVPIIAENLKIKTHLLIGTVMVLDAYTDLQNE